MKKGLLLKLLGINIPVVALVILVLWLVLDTLAADYFSVLMNKYHISPIDAHHMFIHSIHRYLLWTSICALLLGGLLSFALTRMVLKPLHEMTYTARLISDGDYSTRVRAGSKDEIGELATAFNQMAGNLERIERLRRNMISDVAHELRTPLTNIRGYLEALQDGAVHPTMETINTIHEDTLRLVHLVEDLLRLARADAAKSFLLLEEVDLYDLISRILKYFDLRFSEKSIKVVQTLNVRSHITADPGKLSQVIENLVRNALQYTPEGGFVHLRVQSSNHEVTFALENSGPGIAAMDLPFIFERFYRGEKSRSRDYGGTGIGLAIVKEIIEAHGGSVGVESDTDKTLFWFTLPVESHSGTRKT